MGMNLNIKSAELKRLESLNQKRVRIDAILEQTSRAMRGGPGSADIDALLYDEMGLPKS